MSKSCPDCGGCASCHPNCPSGDVVHEPDPLTIRACAEQAIAWYQQFSEQPSMGYEPDYGKQLDRMITELAEDNGFTYAQVMDEIYLAECEHAKKEHAKIDAAVKLNKQLDDPDMTVSYNTYSQKFTFTYTCTDLNNVSSIALRISNELAAASEQAWNEILLESKTNTSFAKFTAEGGFSLN